MLHRMPTRQPRQLLLWGVCGLALVLCVGFGVFYFLYAPNWDVTLLCWALALVLLWPFWLTTSNVWGEYAVQVEHAGVVISRFLWGHRLKRQGWSAEQIRHFDWEESSDGLLSLRFVLRRADGSMHFHSVLHTDSPYAMGAILRDLELHYPGCGLYEQRPSGVLNAANGVSRVLSVAMLSGGLVMLCWFGPTLITPLRVVYSGEAVPAEVLSVEWSPTTINRSATYRLLVRPEGTNETVRTAGSFHPAALRVPLPGQRLEVLYKAGAVCYLPGEVLAFLLPLPGIGGCLLLLWLGVWGLMRSIHRPH